MNIFETTPVRVFPQKLAVRIGDREAMFVALIHYLLSKPEIGKEIDGEKYFVNTIEDWYRDFEGMWSQSTIKRIIGKCVKAGYLIQVKAGKYHDQTRGYRVDYTHPVIAEVGFKMNSHIGSKAPDTADQSEPLYQVKMNQCSYPVSSPEAFPESISIPVFSKTKNTGGSASPETLKESGEIEPVDTVEPEENEPAKKTVAQVADEFGGDFNLEEELMVLGKNTEHGPSVSRYWRRLMYGYGHATKCQPTLNAANLKKLKNLFRDLPENGPELLATVLEHYVPFRQYAKANHDINLPVKPDIEKLSAVKPAITEFEPPSYAKPGKYKMKSIEETLAEVGVKPVGL